MAPEELEARIKVLEDIEAIKKLKATYCYLVDEGMTDPSKLDELLTRFTETAKADFGAFGFYDGKAEITKFLKEIVPGTLSFCIHMVHNPIIEVEGDKAKGSWYFEVPGTNRAANRAVWIQGKYEEEYVREGGQWKFSFVKAIFSYATPYDEGWVKTPMFAG